MHQTAFLCPFHFGTFIIRSLPFLASFFQPFITSLILYGHKFVCAMPFAQCERERELYTVTITLFSIGSDWRFKAYVQYIAKKCG